MVDVSAARYFVLLAALAATTHGSLAAPASGPSQLLKEAITANRASFNRIQSLRYHLEVDLLLKRFPHPLKGSAEILRSGDQISGIYKFARFDEKGQEQPKESRCAINGDYSIVLTDIIGTNAYKDIGGGRKWDAGDNVSIRNKFALPPEFMCEAFGDARNHFWELDLSSDFVRYEATTVLEERARPYVEIRRYANRRLLSSDPDFIWKLDPSQGYLSVKNTAFKFDGAVWVERLIVNEEVSPGIWVPVEYHEKKLGESPGAQDINSPTSLLNIKLSNVKVNVPTTSADFELASLHLGNISHRINVIETGLDGHMQLFRANGDSLDLAEIQPGQPGPEPVANLFGAAESAAGHASQAASGNRFLVGAVLLAAAAVCGWEVKRKWGWFSRKELP